MSQMFQRALDVSRCSEILCICGKEFGFIHSRSNRIRKGPVVSRLIALDNPSVFFGRSFCLQCSKRDYVLTVHFVHTESSF